MRVLARDDRQRAFTASVDKVLVEKDFYSLHTAAGRSADLERLLARIEGEGANAIARMTSGAFPPNHEDRAAIALFVSAQWLRGWDMREATEAMLRRMIEIRLVNTTRESVRCLFQEELGRTPTTQEIDDLVAFAKDPRQYRVEVPANRWLVFLLSVIVGSTRVFDARKWQLLRLAKGALVTSDAPVSLVANPSPRPWTGIGLATADEIVMPLDRSHALVMHRDASSPEAIRVAGQAEALLINLRTAANGRKFIVHHPDDDPLSGIDLPPSRPRVRLGPAPRRMVRD